MRAEHFLPIAIVAATLLGCQSTPTSDADTASGASSGTSASGGTEKTVAYIDGRPATRSALYTLLAEAHGGEALSELILDRAVPRRLEAEGLALTQADLDAERERLMAGLAEDRDQAARLFSEMRDRLGLGQTRYEAMVRRNAGLRKLVADGVRVTEPAIRQAYQRRYGERYQARLITAGNAATLGRLRRRVLEGASFTDLAIAHSTDPSAAQGGLLSPISPADASYPKAVREALPKLSTDSEPARLSPVIALAEGYALLRLEAVTRPEAPAYAEVRAALRAEVRRELERVRMQQLTRAILEDADVVVLDPALAEAWDRHRERVAQPSR